MKKTMRIAKMILIGLALVLLAGCGPSQAAPAAQPAVEAATAAPAAAATEIAPATSVPSEAASAPPVPATETEGQAVATEAAAAPDEIDALLGLRQARIHLVVDREGDGTRELSAEIDGAGNMRIANTSNGVEANLPTEMYVGFSAVQHELRVMDGQAYREDGEGNEWLPAPGLEDYLERALRGNEGPGLWMRLLSAKRESRGQQTAGDFAAEQFHLSGEVDESAEVVGDIWIDTASGALVKAEFEIPGELYAYSGAGTHYPVLIRLEVTLAQIEPVQLP